jgi:hypothetical protein
MNESIMITKYDTLFTRAAQKNTSWKGLGLFVRKPHLMSERRLGEGKAGKRNVRRNTNRPVPERRRHMSGSLGISLFVTR